MRNLKFISGALLALTSYLPLLTLASFCGESSVPFSFEALPNGQPVLGCARPTCFGWTSDGLPAGSASSFYRVNRRPDGYFRKSADTPRAIAASDARNYKAQTAHCASTFDSEQCPSESQWVGGFGPVLNATDLPLAVQCCDYEPSKLSEDRGVAVVNAGQIVIGGEVLNNGRQYAFDYISDVVKHTSPEGKVSFDVSIRRLPCLPYPSEFTVNVDKSVTEEMLRRFGKDGNKKTTSTFKPPTTDRVRAYHVPNFVDNNIIESPNLIQTSQNVQGPFNAEPVQSIEGPFIAENDAIIETSNALPPGQQAIQGVELPPGHTPNIVNSGGGGSSYYPVSGYCGSTCCGGGSSCGFFCFSADTKVILQGGKEKRMDELELDDWVLSGNDNGIAYSRVESWLHRMPETFADFVKFEMEDGTKLKLTSKHYIFRGDCSEAGKSVSTRRLNADMVYADEVSADHCLFVNKDGIDFIETRISKIEIVKEKGIYAPMTHSGNIVANKIYASCYNIIENDNMQLTLSSYLRDFAESFWGKLWIDENSNDVSEIELIPGMQTLVDLLRHVIPNKM